MRACVGRRGPRSRPFARLRRSRTDLLRLAAQRTQDPAWPPLTRSAGICLYGAAKSLARPVEATPRLGPRPRRLRRLGLYADRWLAVETGLPQPALEAHAREPQAPSDRPPRPPTLPCQRADCSWHRPADHQQASRSRNGSLHAGNLWTPVRGYRCGCGDALDATLGNTR
jgi:hypothetical protein